MSATETVKHTPGPWAYLDIGEVVLADNFDVTIATVDYSRERAEQDGNLIAAAPDMLAALKALIENNRKGVTGQEARKAWMNAHAAIAKAEGRAS